MNILQNRYLLMLITLPIIFMLHNAEKVIFINYWLQNHTEFYPLRLSFYLPYGINPELFFRNNVLSLIISFIIPAFFSLIAIFTHFQRFIFYALLLLAVTMLMNAIQHFGVSLLFWDLNPGTITAITIFTPYSFFMIKTIRQHWQVKEIPQGIFYLLPFTLILPLLNFAFHIGMNFISLF
jgi:hypothetical protein